MFTAAKRTHGYLSKSDAKVRLFGNIGNRISLKKLNFVKSDLAK